MIDKSQIIITPNIEAYQEFFSSNNKEKYTKFFVKDDFLIDDAKAVIKEAYIAESRQKYLFLGAINYNIYAQNSLLKIFEEPPRNTIFILCATSKSSLLPTIRSRLPLFENTSEVNEVDFEFNFKRVDLKKIYEFVNERKNIDKNSLKSTLSAIFTQALAQNIVFGESELEMMDKFFVLSELNSRPQNILLSILLMIYEKVRR